MRVHSITKFSKMLDLARKKDTVQSGRINFQGKMIRLQRYLLMKGKDLNRSILILVSSDKSWSLGMKQARQAIGESRGAQNYSVVCQAPPFQVDMRCILKV